MVRITIKRAALTAAAVVGCLAFAGLAIAGPTVRITKLANAGVAGSTFVTNTVTPAWTISGVNSLAVNNLGHWYVEVESGTTPNRAGAVINLGAGNVTLSEHWAAGYFSSSGGGVCNTDSQWAERGLHLVSMNNADHFVRNIRFTNFVVTATPGQDNTGNVCGVYFDDRCSVFGGGFLVEPAPTTLNPAGFVPNNYLGDAIGAPASANFPSGSIWGHANFDANAHPDRWQDDCVLRINDSNTVLIIAQYSDTPGTANTLAKQAVCRLSLGPTGTVTSTAYVIKNGDPLPGGSGNVTTIVANPGVATSDSLFRAGLNNSGASIFSLSTDAGLSYLVKASGASPAVVTVLAATGDASPIAGLNYGALDGVPCDINDNGDWAFRATLSDGSAAIIKNIGGVTSVVAHTGDSPAEIAPATLQEVGKANGAVRIDNNGKVMWWGRFSSAASNCAYFRDQEILVRQGVTYRTDGTLVGATAATDGATTTQVGLDFNADCFDYSRNGLWAIFRVNGAAASTNISANLMQICAAGDAACNTVTGACCASAGCTMVSAANCAAAGGNYLGNFATCSSCPVACCNTTSGVCTLPVGACPAGTAATGGTVCAPDPCPAHGSCCTGTACTLTLQTGCAGGYTPNGACAPNPCFPADECATTDLVITLGTALTGSTVNATTTITITPATPCGVGGGVLDVFARFTAPATTTYKADTCGSNWDTAISIHDACPVTQTNFLACNDDFATGATCLDGTTPVALRSVINSVALTAGHTYYVRIAGYSTTGSYVFNIGYTNPPDVGACCAAAACVLTDPANCSGTFSGGGTSCSPGLCGGATGVCCRGATCNAGVTPVNCTAPTAHAGAVFVAAAAACNTTGNRTTPCCEANYNKSTGTPGITVQDIFDFLADWFAGSPFARLGGDGTGAAPTVQSIFDFLGAWFGGGC